MAKSPKTFNPAVIPQFMADFQVAEPAVQACIVDLLAMFGPTASKQAVKPLSCGPSGCTDPCECNCSTIDHLTRALASAVQCSNCLNSGSP